MKKKRTAQSGFFNLPTVLTVLLCAVGCSIVAGTLLAFFRSDARAKVSQRTLTFAERAAYQRAIEDVYWRHRLWPKERHGPKPSLDAVISQTQREKKVEDYLRMSQLLEVYSNVRLLLGSYKLKWIAWQSTPNSQRCCGNSLKRSGMILLLSRNVSPGLRLPGAYSQTDTLTMRDFMAN